MITTNNIGHRVLFHFGKVLLGYAYREVDGYYVFMAKNNDSFWSDHVLREIADKLTELNSDWDKQVNDYFKKETK
jgi:hypothetical protein